MAFKIIELAAWIATEPDGTEGICAAEVDGVMMPLIGADADRIESMEGIARRIAATAGLPIQLKHFVLKEIH